MIQKFQKAEQIFIPPHEVKTKTKNIKDFLTQHFDIPDKDLERINEFIIEDYELEKIVYKLPDLIKSKINFDKIQIKFYDEFQEDELILEVTAFASLDFDNSLKIENDIIRFLYNNYPEKSADKLLVFIQRR